MTLTWRFLFSASISRSAARSSCCTADVIGAPSDVTGGGVPSAVKERGAGECGEQELSRSACTAAAGDWRYADSSPAGATAAGVEARDEGSLAGGGEALPAALRLVDRSSGWSHSSGGVGGASSCGSAE